MKKYFDFSHFKGDLFGGVTAGIVALPLALAFGVQSGLGATAGLYGAIFISFFASLFGGTNTQISGPTAPMTAVSMVIIAGLLATYEGDMERALPAILMVFILTGVIQILFGLAGVGKYIRYIPYPVISGFMTGIGVIIIISQLLPVLGYYATEDEQFVQQYIPQAEEVILERILKEEAEEDLLVLEDFKETVRRAGEVSREDIMREARLLADQASGSMVGALKLLGRAFNHLNLIDLILALLTILIIYLFKRVTTAVPSTLVALLVVSAGAYFLIPEYRTIGTIPGGFPIPKLEIFTQFALGDLAPYIFTAASLAALGAIDSLLTSVVADNMTKTKHKPNKELIGQGIGNSIAAIFGGIPGAGATIRTVVNIQSGGKTRLSGMIAGLLLLAALLALSPLASQIPAAVLAGILITVGIGVMDYKGLRHIRQLPLTEVGVMFIVLFLTVFVGLIEAVAVGMILASVLFMKKISDVVDEETKTSSIKEFSSELPWEENHDLLEHLHDKVYVKHLNGPLFFGFSSNFQDLVNDLPDINVVIIRMEKVPYVDQSGLYAMEDAIDSLKARDITVMFTGLYGQPKEMFEQFNVVPGRVKSKFLFEDIHACSKWLEEHVEGNGEVEDQVKGLTKPK